MLPNQRLMRGATRCLVCWRANASANGECLQMEMPGERGGVRRSGPAPYVHHYRHCKGRRCSGFDDCRAESPTISRHMLSPPLLRQSAPLVIPAGCRLETPSKVVARGGGQLGQTRPLVTSAGPRHHMLKAPHSRGRDTPGDPRHAGLHLTAEQVHDSVARTLQAQRCRFESWRGHDPAFMLAVPLVSSEPPLGNAVSR